MLQALAQLLDAGGSAPAEFRIYDGTPPVPGAEVTDQVLLGVCTCSVPAASVSGGVLTFAAVSEEDLALATGTATWGRLVDGNGDWIADFDVGLSGGAFLPLNDTDIKLGGVIRINSAVISI
jgi:hypothetical protein